MTSRRQNMFSQVDDSDRAPITMAPSEEESQHEQQSLGSTHGNTRTSSSSTTTTTTTSSSSSAQSIRQLLCYAVPPGALLLAAGLGCMRIVHRLKRSSSSQPRQPPATSASQQAPTLAPYASHFRLHLERGRLEGTQRPLLEGLSCVVAENVALQGAAVGCGIPGARLDRPVAAESAPAVQRLLSAGVVVCGQGSTQPLDYPTLGDNISNPAASARVAGGGCSGAAAAVALGEAQLGLGCDWLGSLRLPAAAMGLCALVATPGTLGPPHTFCASSGGSAASSSGSACEALGLLSRDLPQLCSVASCLGLPGAANLRHDVTQLVMAEDLFQLCDPELAPGVLAVKRAVLAWAGQEQAGSVQLLNFMAKNTGSWHHFATGADSSDCDLPPSLAAMSRAACLLHNALLWQRYRDSLPAGVVAAASPVVAAALEQGAAATPAQLSHAQAVASEVQAVLREAVKKNLVVVVPVAPAAPPLLSDAPAASQRWLQRCQAFASITSLGGCPCLVLPVGQLPGGGPLAVALFGAPRTDQRLLAVADKLMPHITAEMNKICLQAAAAAAPAPAQQQPPQAKSGKARAARDKQQQDAAEVDPRRAERAERAKARGNAAFTAGRFTEAIKAYSQAIALHPANPVYVNNRAMAYLKAFSFEAAEADCSRALASPALTASDRVKALLRRGTARMHKGDLRGARADFREVLAAEPHNRQAQEELKSLQQQELDMESTRRQQALAAAAVAAAGGGGGPDGSAGQAAAGFLEAEQMSQLLHMQG